MKFLESGVEQRSKQAITLKCEKGPNTGKCRGGPDSPEARKVSIKEKPPS